MCTTTEFMNGVDYITRRKPKYLLGHSGLDGYCDCIGLPIGAAKKAGTTVGGIHGCNYVARRKLIDGVHAIKSVSELQYGDLVFKARNPGEAKYDLPARYKKGKSYYNGDLRDYYHVGVVTSTNPLTITHMTSPTIKVDTSLGKWAYRGRLACVADDPIIEPVLDSPIAPIVPIDGDPYTVGDAIVIAGSGKTVNLRAKASTSGRIIRRVPIGNHVTITKDGNGTWAKVKYGSLTGYMMTKFLGKEAA